MASPRHSAATRVRVFHCIVYTEHLRIPVGAGALHAERTGRGGPAVLLLHGFGTCSFLWRAVAPRLANAGFTAVALDLLGHGESDQPLEAAYGLAAQAEYVERAMSALRLPSAAVVGQDIGALVALLLAARRPARVQRLALLSPSNPYDLPGAAIRAVQRQSAKAVLGGHALFGALPLLQTLLQEAVQDRAVVTPRLVARYLAPWVGDDAISRLLLMASAVDLSEEDLRALQGISRPALVLLGDADTDAAAAGDALIADLALTDGHVDLVPGCARLIPEEQPALLVQRLLAWAGSSAIEAPATCVSSGRDQRNS